MTRQQFARDADRAISLATENVARGLTRRSILVRGVKGATAMFAAATVGGVYNVRSAFAATCSCSCIGGPCDLIGNPCPGDAQSKCPTGCSVCTSADCAAICGHPSGQWVCCTGCGTCGMGYILCVDCWCGGLCADPYSTFCTCKSVCICQGCCRAADVQAQMARDGLIAAPV
jgi:hypothetical protein